SGARLLRDASVVLDCPGRFEIPFVNRLEAQHEVDLVADDDPAPRNVVLPRHAEIVAVDLGPALEADPAQRAAILVPDPEGRLPLTEVDDVELDHTRAVSDRHIDRRLEVDVSGALDEAPTEGDSRVMLHVEEVCASKVGVTHRLAGPELGCVDLALERRLEAALPVELEFSVDVLEETADPGHHHMPRPESDLGMTGLEEPGRHSVILPSSGSSSNATSST